MIDKSLVSGRFSAHAAHYEHHACIQRIMADHLVEQLVDCRPDVPPRSVLLEVGSGTGLLTRGLLDAFPDCHLHAIDIAPGMTAEARRRIPDPRVTFLCADAEETPLEPGYAAVASSATFQWFSRPRETVRRLAKVIVPGGMLAFSTLGEGTFSELRASFADVARDRHRDDLPYPGLSYLSGDEVRDLLPEGFTTQVWDAVLTESFPSVRHFLRNIKGLGAAGHRATPLPPSFLRELERVYETRFGRDGVVPATYRCLWVLAQKDIP